MSDFLHIVGCVHFDSAYKMHSHYRLAVAIYGLPDDYHLLTRTESQSEEIQEEIRREIERRGSLETRYWVAPESELLVEAGAMTFGSLQWPGYQVVAPHPYADQPTDVLAILVKDWPGWLEVR